MFNIVANLKETCIRESVPGKIRFEALDGTRAIALLWVLLFHSWNYIIAILDTPGTLLLDKLSWARDRPWATLIIRTGDMGVDIFFVLSGFLIGFVLLNEYQKTGSFNFGKFYLKRFLRLWPVLFISTVFVLVVGWTAKGELSRFAWCFPYAWRHLIFVSSLLPIPGGEIGGVVGVCFGHFWSTSTEVRKRQFRLMSIHLPALCN
jgi:peptidoglycan/LPS O-acetylase OafA/YrhL